MKTYKIISIAIISALIFSSAGCNLETSNNQLLTSQNSTTVEKSIQNATDAPNTYTNARETMQTYDEIKNYSEGLIWIRYGAAYRAYGKQYWGCTDKNGNMLFQFKCSCDRVSDDNPPENFSNGYSYYQPENSSKIYVIDKKGNVCSSYDNSYSGENKEVAHGYGYTVFKKHYSDFDTAYYEYIIYNPDGSTLYSFKTENDTQAEVYYRGCGVFSFHFNNTTYFYFTNSQKWGEYNYDFYYNYQFKNDLLFVDNSTVIDSSGNIINIDLAGFEDYDKINEIYGNSIVMYSIEKQDLIAYNIDTKKASHLNDKKLLEKSRWDFGNYEGYYCFNNEGFVLAMTGSDGNQYIVVLDYNMNILSDPILANICQVYNDGQFSVTNENTTDMYKMDGSYIYTLNQKGYKEFINCGSSELLFAANDESDFAAFDKDGNLLFDTIDITNVVTKELD